MPKLIGKPTQDVLDTYLTFVAERESVRLKKEAGEKRPWTTNPIIQQYRFCNIRRMDDTVSHWLLTNWYEPYFSHKNMLVAVALARFFNQPSALEYITYSVFGDKIFKEVNFHNVEAIMRDLKKRGEKIWNSAYMVRGVEGKDKVESVIDNVKPLITLHLDTSSMQATWKQIKSCYGFGSFQAGQVVADLRWAVTGEWSDKLTWAPLGPGSSRGMNRLHNRPIDFPLKQEQFEDELIHLTGIINDQLPKSLTSRLESIDIQNSLCEADKMFRVLNGEGRPKQLYKGC